MKRKLRGLTYEAGSSYNDNKIGIKKLPVRSQDTITRWVFSDDGRDLVGLEQSLAGIQNGDRYVNLSDNGLITIPRKKIKSSKTRFLSKAEWARLESELPEHLRPIAQFAISTGLRRANVLQLKWAQIDMQRAVSYVDATDAKGDASIPVPLSKYALDVLKSQQGKHKEYVFTYQGNPLGVFKSSWKKALSRESTNLALSASSCAITALLSVLMP